MRGVDVVSEDLDLARGGDVTVALVDAIEATEQRRLAHPEGPIRVSLSR